VIRSTPEKRIPSGRDSRFARRPATAKALDITPACHLKRARRASFSRRKPRIDAIPHHPASPMTLDRPLFHLLGSLILTSALTSCGLISDAGPLKTTIKNGGDRVPYQLVEVKSRADIPAAGRSYGKAEMPPHVKGQGYTDKVRARDSLLFVITDLSEQSPFFSRGDTFKYGPIEVPEDGRISIPYSGEIQVNDRSLSQISSDLAEKIERVSNTAEVNVARSDRVPRTANVIGEVKNPGPVPLERGGLTSLDILAASGGPGDAEHLFRYTLRRDGKDYHFDYRGFRSNSFIVEEGDLLTVNTDSDNRFHVMGAITKPTTVAFPTPNPTLADALGAATGFDERRSDPSGVFVFRKGEPDMVYTFNLRDPSIMALVQRFPMKGEDIIYVTEAPLARWNRLITQILPISVSQAVNSAARYAN
jgi:polysaccharide biosynthesis/export protein